MVAKDLRRVLDEVLDQTRGLRRGPVSVVDILLMDYFERQQAISQAEDLLTFPVDLARDPRGTVSDVKRKVKRKKSAYGKRLSKELKRLNKLSRTKSGKLRKGVSQGSILKKAHKNVKKAMKRR